MNPEIKFSIILKEEDTGYSVQCVELSGCLSQGETREEALENIREAIIGYLEAFPEEINTVRSKREIIELSV